MIFINGEYHCGGIVVGPWTTDQEIKEMVRKSKRQDLSPQQLTELRTACRESLAQEDANFRRPYTTP